jgi:hypothetical protein
MAITSGTPVKSGYYWNSRRLAITHVAKDGEVLGGRPGDAWVRMPTAAVVAAAPVLGGLFVVAFPFFGAWAVASAIARAVGGRVKEGAADLAANLAPGPVPGEAHLTGKAGAEAGEAVKDAKLEELEKEIGERRR